MQFAPAAMFETSSEPTVRITSPDKLYFPALGITKGQVIDYYAAVAEALLRWSQDRPIILKRYPNGIEGESFYQKRAPGSRPDWVRTATYRFPSGRSADEVVLDRPATLVWTAQIGNIEIHAHPVRAIDMDHPDELRVDLDPGPGVPFDAVRRVALITRELLLEHDLHGWPKTSGGRGMHIYVPIERRWTFDQVRRAALALAREVSARHPDLATARWWKEERHGVFVDYNQNARDRTMAAAYSLRANPQATVSMPVPWDEVASCEPSAYTIGTVPGRLARHGDPFATTSDAAGSIESLLQLADDHEKAGLGDAPWPPHFAKQPGEPKRARAPLITVARAKRKADAMAGLERWKRRHPEAAERIQVEDVLVDSMRGRYSTWTRIRVNLRNVPKKLRPAEETPDPDFEPDYGPET